MRAARVWGRRKRQAVAMLQLLDLARANAALRCEVTQLRQKRRRFGGSFLTPVRVAPNAQAAIALLPRGRTQGRFHANEVLDRQLRFVSLSGAISNAP